LEPPLFGYGFFGDGLRRGFRGRFSSGVGDDLHLDVRRDFTVELDAHAEFTETLEGFGKLNLAAIDLEALGLKAGGDVG